MSSVPGQTWVRSLHSRGLSPWLRRRIFWGLAISSCLGLFALTVTQSFVARSLTGRGLELADIVFATCIEFFVLLGICVAAVQLGYGFPIRRDRRLGRCFAHFLASVVLAVLALGAYSLWTMWTPPVLIAAGTAPLDRFLTFLLGGTLQGSIIVYWSALGIQHAADYDHELQAGRLRSARLEAQLADARLAAMRMQLQPHFLFNTLNAMSTLALRDGSRGTVQMISRLADFLRLTLDSDGSQTVPLRQEIAFAESYLAIEQVRLGERLAVEIDIDPAMLAVPVPNLALQPLVENAIRHGISKAAGGGRVFLRGFRRQDRLRLEVVDSAFDAPGQVCDLSRTAEPSTRLENGEGIGLATTRRRLALIYDRDFALGLEPAETGGTKAVLEVPLKAALEADGSEVPLVTWPAEHRRLARASAPGE